MRERREKWFNVKVMIRFGKYRCRGGIRQNKISVPLKKKMGSMKGWNNRKEGKKIRC